MADVVAGSIVSCLVEKVIDYSLSFLTDKFMGQKDLQDEIRRICDMLETIQDVIKEVEQKQVTDEVDLKWVKKLRDVAYDIEDALDDYTVGSLADDGRNLVYDFFSGKTTTCQEMVERLKSIEQRLDEINRLKEQWIHGGKRRNKSQLEHTTTRETSGLSDKIRPMVGREEIQAKIKEQILCDKPQTSHGSEEGPSHPKISLIAIVGMGGIGKTTLAQDLFNDEGIKAAFPYKRWVFVGQSSDAKGIINQIIDDESIKAQNLNALHSTLIQKIKDEKFFIALDDCWCTDSEMWNQVWRPLNYGEKGGVVVMTTRDQTVAKAIHNDTCDLQYLQGMSNEECMQIFKRCAFKGQKPERYHDLNGLCEQIVEKLKGVPLAATMMGSYLNMHLDKRENWVSVANDAEWLRTGQGYDLVDRVTRLSYHNLPSHLKPCFAYCSVFPKGYRFYKEELVRMWIAQGCFSPRENQLMEHIGRDYFDDLCHRSFLQRLPHYFNHYLMHDLVHDFSQKIFPEGSLVMGAGGHTFPQNKQVVRHLSFSCAESESAKLLESHKFVKLRTLLLHLIDVRPSDAFAKFKYLRVLKLRSWNISEFPDSIGHLKLLRYLDISCPIETLPEPVCDLINLQFLILNNDCALPAGMSKLVNLRHLEVGEEAFKHLKEVGKLTALQSLPLPRRFRVRRESGWRMEELKDLNHLHGKLEISGLQNVVDKEEAELANLKKKVYLEELVLEWGDLERTVESVAGHESASIGEERDLIGTEVPNSGRGESSSHDEAGQERTYNEVLGGLHPPPHLKRLTIVNNPRPLIPTLGQLPSLQKLTISKAHKLCTISPVVLCHLTSLQKLTICECNELAMLAEEQEINAGGDGWVFPCLSVLKIWSCPKLASLSPILRHSPALTKLTIWICDELAMLAEEQEINAGGDGWVFPSLSVLEIRSCPKLASLSPILRHSTALTKLDIEECDELAMLAEEQEINAGGDGSVFSFLEKLNIGSCPKLTSLSTLLRNLPSLKELSIRRCPEQRVPAGTDISSGRRREKKRKITHQFQGLKCLSTDARWLLKEILLQKLRSLEELTISNCDLFCYFTAEEEEGFKHLLSLKKLKLLRCRNLQRLPSSMHSLRSLTEIQLHDCPAIQCLPEEGLPTSLRELVMRKCPLLSERCTEGGADHPKIPTTTISIID